MDRRLTIAALVLVCAAVSVPPAQASTPRAPELIPNAAPPLAAKASTASTAVVPGFDSLLVVSISADTAVQLALPASPLRQSAAAPLAPVVLSCRAACTNASLARPPAGVVLSTIRCRSCRTPPRRTGNQPTSEREPGEKRASRLALRSYDAARIRYPS